MLTRGKVVVAAAGVAVTGGLVMGAQVVGAQDSARSAGGVVHMYEYAPPTTVPGKIVLTGAISDHGLNRGGVGGPNHTYNKLVLTKGSFEVNVGKLKFHQHLDTSSCTLVVKGSGPMPVVKGSGTGAYRGITGTSRAKTGFVGVFPKKSDGSCNLNAPAKPGFGWSSAVGRFSLK